MTDKNSTEFSAAELEIIGALTEFRDTLRAKEPVDKKFTVRSIELTLHPREYTADDVKRTRSLLNLSQPVFAQLLGVGVKTVRAWEQGLKTPSPIACRFMDEINNAPDYWMERLKQIYHSKGVQKIGS